MSNLTNVIKKCSEGTVVYKIVGKNIYFSRLEDLTNLVNEEEFNNIKREFFSRIKTAKNRFKFNEKAILKLIRQVAVVGKKSEKENLINHIEKTTPARQKGALK